VAELGAVSARRNDKALIWSQLKSRYYAASDELHTLYRLDEYLTSGMSLSCPSFT